MGTIKLKDVIDAYDTVDFGGTDDSFAWISRQTGVIFIRSGFDEEEEVELPEDVDDLKRYAGIPDRNDLDLGNALVFRFVKMRLPDQYDKVDAMFRSRGAYGRYKDLLGGKGLLDEWYSFEEAEKEAALRQWCRDVGLTVDE